ncbi:hypothetical protein AgCh_019641 [Apium graveolens]
MATIINSAADDLFSAETNPSVGSCTNSTPCHCRNVIDSVGSCTKSSTRGHRRNVVGRILVSLLSYGIAFSFITVAALLYTSNSALASSYGSMGGSSYSSTSSTSSTDDDDGDLADPNGTMLIFQVGVLDKQRVLQRKLNKIAEVADTSTLEGLNYVLKETVRALTQHDNSSSNYYSHLFEKYDTMERLGKDFRQVLDKFDIFVKDDKTFENVDGVKYKKIPVRREMEGEYVDSFAVLQTLERVPKEDIKSVRVMWTPQKEDEVLTEEDLRNQTNLIPIVNGRVFLIR